MTTVVPSASDFNTVLECLSRLTSAPPGAAVDENGAVELRRALLASNQETLQTDLSNHLPRIQVSASAAARLLDQQASRGFTAPGLALAEALARRWQGDERLADIRLRFLLGLDRRKELVLAIEGILVTPVTSAQLAYRLVLALNRTMNAGHPVDEALRYRAVSKFMGVIESSPEKNLWLGRYYREMGNIIVGLKHYLAAWDTLPETSRFRAVALREGADMALSGDRWGRDAPILLRAREAGVESSWPWRAEAVERAFDYVADGAALDFHANLPGTAVYSHLYATLGTPEIAFDYLLDEVLSARAAYTPANTLLMFGTSLAGGGMERIFANSYRAVSATGAFERVRMALLNFAPGAASSFYLDECGAQARDITVLSGQGVPEFPVSLLPIGLGRRVTDAYQLIIGERPRIIHAWNDLPGIVAAYAGLLAGCPRIFVHFHHMRAINLSSDRNLVRSYPYCYRRLLERPEMELLFVADASAQDYADWWSVTRSPRFRRLYNGFAEPEGGTSTREEARRALALSMGALVVGVVFRFHGVKRPLLWIEAARLIHAALPEAMFVMVGDGALLEEARAKVASLGLEKYFRFPGQVKNVSDYLACFDLFMLTSQSEGLPNSLIEAQLAGVPVLSTHVGGAGETFIPGVTGRLAPDASAETLAKLAVECLSNEGWRNAARARSRQHALSVFGIDRYMENLLALYRRPSTIEQAGA
ncbi:MAG: glycosyltransferase [Pseudomonadota bacterium]|nr:glycosyltransferase [Pseudomonadota bacterium]